MSTAAPAAPSAPRVALAALSALAVASVLSSGGGPAESFIYSLPALILACTMLLSRAGATATTFAAIAILLLAPAAGAAIWGREFALMDSKLLPTGQALEGRLRLSARALEGVGPLALGGAVGLFILGGRRALAGTLVLAGCGLAARLGIATLEQIEALLLRGRGGDAALLTRGLPLLALLPLPGVLLGASGGQRLLWLLCFAVAAWIPIPPIVTLVSGHRPAHTAVAVPPMAPGPGQPGPALPLAGLDAALGARGLPLEDALDWTCATPVDPLNPWPSVVRAGAAIALEAEGDLAVLDEAIDIARMRNVRRFGLVGQAPDVGGPLGDTLAWPTLDLILDRPPAGSRWLSILSSGTELLRDGDGVCVLVPGEGLTIANLVRQVRALQSPTGDCVAFSFVPAPERTALEPGVDAGCAPPH